MEENLILSHCYLFPNGMVVSFDKNEKQVSELQGEINDDLIELLRKHINEDTKLHGFENINL